MIRIDNHFPLRHIEPRMKKEGRTALLHKILKPGFAHSTSTLPNRHF